MTRVTIPDTVLFTQMGEEAVLVNQDSGVYVGLDRVGTVMWQTLARCPELDRASAELVGHFDVEPNRCAADLHQFVRELVQHRLLLEDV